jgi:retron-type reverse transcriptase
MTEGGAESRAEMSEQPQRMKDGIPQELRIERQAATAAKDKTGPRTDKLMEEVLRRENLFYALKRVQANKGAPGVDGMTVDELPAYLRKQWPHIRDTPSSAQIGVEAVEEAKDQSEEDGAVGRQGRAGEEGGGR